MLDKSGCFLQVGRPQRPGRNHPLRPGFFVEQVAGGGQPLYYSWLGSSGSIWEQPH
jgi:hypothetical protein